MVIIQADKITMEFRIYNDRLNSLKEFFIKKITRKLKSQVFTALEDVSFSINRGEVFGVIGSNGAGKSTLLKLISGIMVPTKGDFKIKEP
jgi:ABC-type polysaccharide/polyol phosphate transport system ATPase subunit